jgi:protein O-mannosyl-transferase
VPELSARDARAPGLFSAPVWLAVLIALLALLLYWPSLTGSLVFDDHVLLEYRPRVLTMTVREAFTTDFWGMDPPVWKSMHYRPLALLAYAGIYRLFGMEIVAFHLVNLLLHGATVLALFLLLDALRFPRRVCLLATALFAVDPLHVEAVAWITGMMETLMVALSLASLACFARRQRVASVALAGAAMLVKETALVLPAMVFLIEWYRLAREAESSGSPARQPAWRAAEIAALPYIPLVLICLAARGAILPRMPEALQTRFVDGMPDMAGAAAAYLRLLFWPWPLALAYSVPGALGITAAIGFGSAAAIAVARLRRKRQALFRDVLLAIGLVVLPLAAPVAASPIMLESLQIQDRYAYLSSAGACLLVTLVLTTFQTAWLKKAGLAAMALLILTGACGAWRQIPVWANSEAMWRHALQVTPDSQFVSISLGRDLARDGRFHEATQVFEQALRYRPRSNSLRTFLTKTRQLEQLTPRFRVAGPAR